jgi:hypothetical protein
LRTQVERTGAENAGFRRPGASGGGQDAKPPAGKYRPRMRQRLNKRHGKYGERWQASACRHIGRVYLRRLCSAVQWQPFNMSEVSGMQWKFRVLKRLRDEAGGN